MATHEALPNKPLVEALLEIKWGTETELDPGFHVLVGRLYERLRDQYPELEDLPIAQVPPVMTVHMVRHRFRRTKGGWPLVQVGPGILTLNETEGYQWDDFSSRSRAVLPVLYDAHPSPGRITINQLLLRYINATEFDYLADDVLQFLRNGMRTTISIPESLFGGPQIQRRALGLALQLTFPAEVPRGALNLQIRTGRKRDRPAVVWEFHFRSSGDDIPPMPHGFDGWLDQAHRVIEHWFFELAKGALLDRFMSK